MHTAVLRGQIDKAPAPTVEAARRTNLRTPLTSFVGPGRRCRRGERADRRLPAHHARRARRVRQDAAGRRGLAGDAGSAAGRCLAGGARCGRRRHRGAGRSVGVDGSAGAVARRSREGAGPRRPAHRRAAISKRSPGARQLRARRRSRCDAGRPAARGVPAVASPRDQPGAARHHRRGSLASRSLGLPPEDVESRDLLGYDAVRLLVDRARRSDRGSR